MHFAIWRHLLAFAISGISVVWLIPLICNAAIDRQILDMPDGMIKLHRIPVPHFGGVAICLAVAAGLLPVFASQTRLLWLYLGSLILLFLGAVDDLRILSPFKKFLGQLFVVLCFLSCGFVLKASFFSSSTRLIISGFWMLTVINAFNLVDVMDGLASSIAFFSAGAFAICAFWVGNFEVTLLLVALMGALIGFFYYNAPPASIYLGDAGAHFIGGILAAIPLLLSWSEYTQYGFLVPAIILGVPLSEVVTLVVIRLKSGISPFAGSPHHFSIYLKNKGWSCWSVLLISSITTVLLSALALLLFVGFISLEVVLVMLMLAFAIWCYVVFV